MAIYKKRLESDMIAELGRKGGSQGSERRTMTAKVWQLCRPIIKRHKDVITRGRGVCERGFAGEYYEDFICKILAILQTVKGDRRML